MKSNVHALTPGRSAALACPACRTVAAPASRFCAQCGTRLSQSSVHSELAGTGERPRRATLGERRQVTVLFSDLVDSTALAARLDPEDMCELMRVYQSICAQAITPYEGYIAQTLGDGILVYFGYPEAHEDDAERATRAGLAITTAVADPDGMLRRTWGNCAVRVGIHTGLVVAGEVGEWDTRANMAITGETPNVAARLQQLAGENQVVIGPRTQRLIEGLFELDALGPQRIKGLDEPLPAFRVRSARADTRFDARARPSDAPLIGRDGELRFLLERWRAACAGRGRMVLLSGAAGIGKSRLLQALHAQIKPQQPYRLQYQCSPFFRNSALYPVVAQLHHAACIRPTDAPALKLRKLRRALRLAGPGGESELSLIAGLLQIPHEGTPRTRVLSAQRRLDDTIDALVAQVVRLSRQRPVLVVFEDAHWIDPSTIRLIGRALAQLPGARVMMVVTHRPDWESPFRADPAVTSLNLERLDRLQSESIVRHLAQRQRLPSRVTDEIIARSDGIPLFVEELTKAVLESDATHAPLRVPASLQDSLTARLDRIGPLKFVAQLGACIGRTFLYELLVSVAQLDEKQLRESLDRLVVAELLSQRGDFPEAMFTFRHALLQNAAYDSMLRAERRIMHAAIARCMMTEQKYGVEHQPELVAQHLAAAEDHEAALRYWLRAGELAQRRSAHSEAIAHLTSGLESLAKLKRTPAVDSCEIDFRLALARSHMSREGWSGHHVSASYRRARELARELKNPGKECLALWGLWANDAVSGALGQAGEHSEQYLAAAAQQDDHGAVLMASSTAVINEFSLSNFAAAQRHAQRIHAEYRFERDHGLAHLFNHDPVAIASMFEGFWLFVQGYPERATRALRHSLEHGRRLQAPFQLCYALMNAAGAMTLQGDDPAALGYLDEGLQLASEHRIWMFPMYGPLMAAPALLRREPTARQLDRLCQSMQTLRDYQIRLHVPLYLLNLAAAHEHMGRDAEAEALVCEGIGLVARTGERWIEPELWRARARLARKAGHVDAAERWLDLGLAQARSVCARSFELRLACDLMELRRHDGRAQEARELLASLYAWFTEGTDARDMCRARELLASE